MTSNATSPQGLTQDEKDATYSEDELKELARNHPNLVFYAPLVKELTDHHKIMFNDFLSANFEEMPKPSKIVEQIKRDGRFNYFEPQKQKDGVETYKWTKPVWIRCMEHFRKQHFEEKAKNAPSYYTYGNDLHRMQCLMATEFKTLQDFVAMSMSNDFGDCRERLRDFVWNPHRTNQFPDVSEVEERCRLWALQVTNEYGQKEIGWARRLDNDRKTVTYFLKFLYKCMDEPNPKFTKEDCLNVIRDTLIQELVSLVLPMDRANCLYHMTGPLGGGLAWYAEEKQQLAEEFGIDTHSQRHTMNKFYLYYKRTPEFCLDKARHLKDKWFEIEKRPDGFPSLQVADNTNDSTWTGGLDDMSVDVSDLLDLFPEDSAYPTLHLKDIS
jgi:hypothetical protein